MLEELTALPQTPLALFEGPTSKGKEEQGKVERKGREKRREG